MGPLTHSPAVVMQELLIASGKCTAPEAGGAWPVYSTTEPGAPDEAVTVYDTAGRDLGRNMVDPERDEHHGMQIRVRARTFDRGYAKIRDLAVYLDAVVHAVVTVVDLVGTVSSSYVVHDVIRTSDVAPLGAEQGGARQLFTFNVVVHLRQC